MLRETTRAPIRTSSWRWSNVSCSTNQSAPAGPPRLLIRIDISARPGGSSGTITTQASGVGESKHRTLDGARCREVAEAIAYVVALTVDPNVEGSALPELSPVPPADSTKPETPSRVPAPTRASGSGPPLRLSSSTGIGVAIGALPTAVDLFVAGRIGLAHAPLASLQLGFARLLPSTVSALGGAVQFDGWSARALLCPAAWPHGQAELAACAGGALSTIKTASSGFAIDGASRAWIGSLLLNVVERIRLAPRFALAIDVEGSRPLTRPTWTIAEVGPVHDTGVFGIRGSLSFELRTD